MKRTLAILTVGVAAVALSGCSLLGTLTGGNSESTGGGNSESTEGDKTDVFTVTVGDCVNDGNITGEISEVLVVPCSEPHDSEAYASTLMDDGDFPGDDAVKNQADAACTAEFSTFIGLDYNDSSLNFSYYFPTKESWANGDREILCLAMDPSGQVTGSLKGAAK